MKTVKKSVRRKRVVRAAGTENSQSIRPALAELERLFAEINKMKFGGKLPWVAITVQSTGARSAHGWFYANSWGKKGAKKPVHELNLCPESLNRPIEDVFNTLVHEMVHLHCHINGIADCKRNYHNAKFRDECQKVDLECTQMGRYGWAKTTLSDKLKKELKKLKPKKNAFAVFRHDEKRRKKRGSKLKKWQCPCCQTNIRVGYQPDNFPGVVCRDCDEEYVCMEY